MHRLGQPRSQHCRIPVELPEPLDQDVSILVEHALEAAVEAVVEDPPPVDDRFSITRAAAEEARRAQERHHVRRSEQAPEAPRDPGRSVAGCNIIEPLGAVDDARDSPKCRHAWPGES